MATFTTISSTEVTDAAADRPLLVATSALEALSTTGWINTLTGTIANVGGASDKTDTNWPVANLKDRYGHVLSKPSVASASWSLVAALSSNQTFDTLVIWNHNFGTVAASTVVQIADDAAFTTNLRSIATFTPPATDNRLVSVSLKHTGSVALVYSAVRFIRIIIAKGSTFTPQIGEIWLGKRRQLSHKPLLNYDPDAKVSDIATMVSYGGVRTNFVRNRAKQVLKAELITNTTALASTITDWFTDTNHGTKSFIWIEKPGTVPNTARVMTQSVPMLDFPYETSTIRRFTLTMDEQAPFLTIDG